MFENPLHGGGVGYAVGMGGGFRRIERHFPAEDEWVSFSPPVADLYRDEIEGGGGGGDGSDSLFSNLDFR